MKEKSVLIDEARELFRSEELAVLSTHSKSMEGFPFGSVTTYMSTHEGEPIFYISNLAQHTQNINHNPKMSLTVYSGDEHDANAGARITLLGEAVRLNDEESAKIESRFYQLFPSSEKYKLTHDFNFYKLECHKVRYIGGFGDIRWFSKNDWLLDSPEWIGSEQSMIEHMNQDHKDAMQLILKHEKDIVANEVAMLAINPDGFFLKADSHKPTYIKFSELAKSPGSVRKLLVDMTHQARHTLVQSA